LISDDVTAILERFKSNWSSVLGRSSWYAYDGTWPSLLIFDLLTYSVRERPRISEEQAELVRAASAAIGVLAESCWKLLGVDVKVSLGGGGVEIEATGGRLGEEVQFIPIEEELLRILGKIPSPFPIIGKVRRLNLREDPIIFPFAFGVVTGLSPFGEGPWRKIEPAEYNQFVEPVVKELARSCGDFYSRVLSEESFGQLPELYNSGMIWPLPEFDDSIPGFRGVSAIIDLRDEYGIKPKSLLKLAEGLALNPDPQIQAAGTAFVAGLSEAIPPPRILAAAGKWGTRLGVIRRGMLEARKLSGLVPDWTFAEEIGQAELMRFEIERTIGMLPWIRLGPSAAKQKSLQPLLQALATFQMQPARAILDHLISEDPKRFDLRVQRIYLDMVSGEIEQAERRAKGLISEPGAENDATVFDLLAMSEFGLGRPQEALKRSKVAYANISSNHPFGAEIMGNHSWMLLANKKFEDAISVIDSALRGTGNTVSLLLNKAYALKMLGRNEQLDLIEAELIALAPYDRRVFGNLLIRR
jgi:tetratricopeptide (TPR) repeat protein